VETARDQLLDDLIKQEQRQSDRVQAARDEAAQIVAKAEAEAVAVVDRARTSAEAAARAALEAARREAEAERASILSAAGDHAARLQARADAQRERAVAAVLEQVLP